MGLVSEYVILVWSYLNHLMICNSYWAMPRFLSTHEYEVPHVAWARTTVRDAEGTAADRRWALLSSSSIVKKFNSPSPPPQRTNEHPSHPG